MSTDDIKLAIIGLGYVGLPLAAEFGKKREVIGFDINKERIDALKNNIDSTLELSDQDLQNSTGLILTYDPSLLANCNCFIVSVPTPVDEMKKPDLSPLVSASSLVGKYIQSGSLVIYESTVYPGATEEVCVPVLEKESGLVFNKDFFVGYSPERINPGDKSHRLTDIVKVTSGSTPQIAEIVNNLYGSIISAGTHMASSIKVAEAAKVIENTQRDVNIGLINELAIIFDKLQIDTNEVLLAAGTKWNFLPFKPGLVGGHCIGVDPYYLTHKAQLVGYQPEIILAGRNVNDGMGTFIAAKLMKKMISLEIQPKQSRVLLLGMTFKENCPDLRNTRVIDIYTELTDYGLAVDVYDPWADRVLADSYLNIELQTSIEKDKYHAIIVAVAHDEFKEMGAENIRSFGLKEHILFDLKSIFPIHESDLRL
jgi:UDP-N-acetyl-D-glucosamine/UDP-N-acetyl-D-galactosamine dehydrogenase